MVNTGTIVAIAPGSIGIASGNYSVIQNRGTVSREGAGSTAVQLNGTFGSFLNGGILTAATGRLCAGTGATAVGTTVVNNGIIDGQVAVDRRPVHALPEQRPDGHQRGGLGHDEHDQRRVRPDPDKASSRRASAPRRRTWLLVNGAGAAGRRRAGQLPGRQRRQELHPADGDGRLHRDVQMRGDAEHGRLPQRQPELRADQRDAQPARRASPTPRDCRATSSPSGRALDWAFNAGPGSSHMPALFTLSSSQIPSALTTSRATAPA